jgi:hypothetical protein
MTAPDQEGQQPRQDKVWAIATCRICPTLIWMFKCPRKSKNMPKTTKSRAKDDFVFVARRLGCDEDKGRCEKALGSIAKAKNDPTESS